MSLLLGPMCNHIPGRKDLTDHSDVKVLMPAKSVYIPLFAGNNSQVEILVSEGEHVNIGTRLANTKSAFPVPLYSSVSGIYKGIVKKQHNSLKPQQHMQMRSLCIPQSSLISIQLPASLPRLLWQKEKCPPPRKNRTEFFQNADTSGMKGNPVSSLQA